MFGKEFMLGPVLAKTHCCSKLNRSCARLKCRFTEVCQPNSSTEATRRPLLMFFLQKLNVAVKVDGQNRGEAMLT
jgi:hypothetical protein